jgi:hypothetical protein
VSTEQNPADEYRPSILDETDPGDARVLAELRISPVVRFRDLRAVLRAESERTVAFPVSDDPGEDRWIYYPWRNTVVGLPGPGMFRALRLDRNRNKLTRAEQEQLATLTIGVVGQSVGHSVAYTLALQGACGGLRLADFDRLELSNLNRVPATVLDIGTNKAVVTARRIAELDPYLPVEVCLDGIRRENIDGFVAGLSIVIEECDSLDIKMVVREAARRHRIPLLMETSDRGLLDVERFDVEPDRAPFHGLLGATSADDLRGLSTRDKAPHVIRILDAHGLSDRFAASLAEIDQTLTSWPQLAEDVQLGSASVTAAVRRIGIGTTLRSGRVRVDLDRVLDDLAEPVASAETLGVDEPAPVPVPARPGLFDVLRCAQRAPSGGNAQPWQLDFDDRTVRIGLVKQRSSGMDIGYRGSAVAIGAALYNARTAAAAGGILGAVEFDESEVAGLTAILRLGSGTDRELADDYPGALRRATNRRRGDGVPFQPGVLVELNAAAAAEGGRVRGVTEPDRIAEVAAVLAESDRIRYLIPRLHEEMYAELRWPGEDLDTGIDIRSMELATDELAKLELGRRADVMACLRSWSAGAALGDYGRDRLLSSSAVVAVTFGSAGDSTVESNRPGLSDYARAGMAVERVWIAAERLGSAVQPMSPVFLYARCRAELAAISSEFADTLTSLQGRLLDLLEVPGGETMGLVLRLSRAAEATVGSRRLPVPDTDTRS